MIPDSAIRQLRETGSVTLTVKLPEDSLARKIAACCGNEYAYYVVQEKPDCYWVRLFGSGKQGQGPVGLWHLMTDEEIASIGRQFNIELKAYRFQPGGIIVPKGGYPTCYCVAVAAFRYLGLDKADVRYL